MALKPSLLGAYETTIFLFIVLIRPVLVDIVIGDLEEGVNSMLMTFPDDDKTVFCLLVRTEKNNRKGTSEEFSLAAGMAEYVPQPPSTWPAGPQPPHTSTVCPLEPMDLGVSEQQMPPEQPPSSPELGEDEEVTSPPDPDVPYPDLAPVVFFCLKQTTSPRNWCIKMVCNPYPF
ncbi:voltage-dependent t-type calcium channel subunit alpha-1i isoform x1 [Limosa lapponica baueri]|uniref:Voltage-dependent t-type calcium channel subunit alpha-1i isoform x1 n=1 Tax=Limosa lapponica baueri TaxID=1758121 RepID=A0A2I0USI1_LIMLA|nr:voltage-dependent t-type calcium channel subunit alpha-1i isoform x1 [Limosa lapponica baueri]